MNEIYPKVLTREILLTLMGQADTVLLAGNHIDPALAWGRDGSVFVVAMNGNKNRIEDPDMLASFGPFGGECPHRHRLYANPKARGEGFVVGAEDNAAAQKAQGLVYTDRLVTPTIGFTLLVMMERMAVRTRVAGFSWYMQPGEYKGRAHNTKLERAYVKKALLKNKLFTFTEETMKYLM